MEELESGEVEYKLAEERIWWRRRGVDEGSGIEKIRAGRKNNRRICARIQEGYKRK